MNSCDSQTNNSTPTQQWQEREGLCGNLSQSDNSVSIKELFPDIIFQSKLMGQLLHTVHKIAKSQSSVLIQGESGTGKELIASSIHRLSSRSEKCFMAINCSAIPENLLEAELFGHEKGAFTGADRKRIGHFAAANNGSAFLDEIGDMPLRLQAKLLRVLQDKKFVPVGGREAINADIRIIAATNIDLEHAVKVQNFRLDLYYRLNVLPIHIPPLRERREDIILLLDHFINLSNRIHPHQVPGWFDDEAKACLFNYDWPGNIRQLQNLVERLVIINSGGRLSLSSLPSEFKHKQVQFIEDKNVDVQTQTAEEVEKLVPAKNHNILAEEQNVSLNEDPLILLNTPNFSLSNHVENLENKFILKALDITGQNKNQAAKLLGLNRTTLVERIKKRKLISTVS